MKKICKNCQYSRVPGELDQDIPGSGNWCSNSQSPLFRTRVKDDDGCDGFSPRGKKAPLGMRLKVKGLGFVNKMDEEEMNISIAAEQEARDLLERLGVANAQSFTSGDLVELANLIARVYVSSEWQATKLSELQPGQRFVINGIRTPHGFITIFDGETHYKIDKDIVVMVEQLT